MKLLFLYSYYFHADFVSCFIYFKNTCCLNSLFFQLRGTQKALLKPLQFFFPFILFRWCFRNRLAKVFLRIFYHLVPIEHVTKIGLFALDTLTNVLLVICLFLLEMHVTMCFRNK